MRDFACSWKFLSTEFIFQISFLFLTPYSFMRSFSSSMRTLCQGCDGVLYFFFGSFGSPILFLLVWFSLQREASDTALLRLFLPLHAKDLALVGPEIGPRALAADRLHPLVAEPAVSLDHLEHLDIILLGELEVRTHEMHVRPRVRVLPMVEEPGRSAVAARVADNHVEPANLLFCEVACALVPVYAGERAHHVAVGVSHTLYRHEGVLDRLFSVEVGVGHADDVPEVGALGLLLLLPFTGWLLFFDLRLILFLKRLLCHAESL